MQADHQRSRRIPVLAGLFLGCVLTVPAFAQDAAGALPSEKELEQKDGATVIRGKVLKPEVTVLVRRKTLDVALDLGLDRTFLDRIPAALHDEAFEE